MIKWDLSQEYKVGSTSEKSINVVFQTKIIKNRNHIIISIEGERALDRTWHHFTEGNIGQQNQKTFNRLGTEVNILNLKKGIH